MDLRALDHLVAARVLGTTHRASIGRIIRTWLEEPAVCPAYSTDITAAWQVVEHLKDRFMFKIENPNYWCVRVYANTPESDDYLSSASDLSAPLAICLAALAALKTTPSET